MSPKKRKAIASHMKHKLSTADRNYVIELNVENAAQAHEILGTIISGNTAKKEEDADVTDSKKTKKGSKKEEKQSANENSAGSKEAEVTDSKTQGEKQEGSNEDFADSNDIIDIKKKEQTLEKKKDQDSSDQDSSDEEDEPERVSTSVSNEDKSVLMTVFMDNINAGPVLTLAEVRFKMRSVPYLRRFALDEGKTKKFYDFVRYKTNVVHRMSDSFGPVDEFEFVTSLSSSQRKAWEAHDTYNIEEAFSDWK